MSELDKLRGMLLESGTEFLDHNSDLTIGYYTDPHSVTESMDGTLIVTGLTAEQVMLTLRPGTCTVKAINELGELYGIKLSCGHSMLNPLDMPPIYCPWCGKRVVEVNE